MEKQTFMLEVLVELTDEDIDDIMVSALESGITYWCDDVGVVGDYLGEYASEQISRGGKLMLHDVEEDEYRMLDKEKFIEGFKKYIRSLENSDVLDFTGEKFTVDCGMIDSIGADSIIQLSLFGEVIYA